MNRNDMIQENIGLVYKVVNEMCNNEGDFDDMVGEGMVGLVNAVDNWDASQGKFSSYACQSIKNTILNYIKKENRYKFEEEIDIASAYSFEREVECKDLIEKIMGKLNAEEREYVRLRYVEGYTVREIAEMKKSNYNKIVYVFRKIRSKIKTKKADDRSHLP